MSTVLSEVGGFDDSNMINDECILGADWRERVQAVAQVEALGAQTVGDIRDSFGRPVRLLRQLIGLDAGEAAQALGWSAEQLRAAETRELPLGAMGLMEYLGGLSRLALMLSAKVDNRYAGVVWECENVFEPGAVAEGFAMKWVEYGGGVIQAQGVAQ